MITKTYKKILLKAIGKHPIKQIESYLIEKEIKRPDGKYYTRYHISNVVNGVQNLTHYKKISEEKAAARKAKLEALKA